MDPKTSCNVADAFNFNVLIVFKPALINLVCSINLADSIHILIPLKMEVSAPLDSNIFF